MPAPSLSPSLAIITQTNMRSLVDRESQPLYHLCLSVCSWQCMCLFVCLESVFLLCVCVCVWNCDSAGHWLSASFHFCGRERDGGDNMSYRSSPACVSAEPQLKWTGSWEGSGGRPSCCRQTLHPLRLIEWLLAIQRRLTAQRLMENSNGGGRAERAPTWK